MSHATEPLSADTTSKLLDLARACKAAARVVSMYPATHPAIQDALARITTAGAKAVADGPFVVTVMPDTLQVGGRALARPDQAVSELAAMLHAHSVGELHLVAPLEAPGWHAFLVLVSQSPADIRDEGGITRAWESAGGGPLEVREIDYAEVLRERAGSEDSDWDRILSAYLQGEQADLDDSMLQALVEIVADQQRLAAFIDGIVERSGETWLSAQKAQLAKLLQALAAFVSRSDPGQLDRLLRNVAASLPRMSAEMVHGLLNEPRPVDADGRPEGIDLAGELRERVDESIVAKFIAQSVARDRQATARLAQAFQALVPDPTQRDRVLDAAAEVAAAGPLGREPQFSELWRDAADLLSSYTDAKYVSEDYARELSQSRAIAVEMDRIGDDPPERVAAWMATVSDEQVRRLDQIVLADLLIVETRPDEWRKVLGLAVGRIEQLVLVGDLPPAQELVDTLLRVARDEASPFGDAARTGLARLAAGEVVTHILLYVRQADDGDMPRVTRFCLSLGKSIVGRLVDALLVEDGARTIRRLREVLISFGSAARPRVVELCASPNPAVRRTAIELVRAIGGSDSLALLMKLLDDEEIQVQREALRAIVQMGTDEGFERLREALTSGSERTREMITSSLTTLRDDRAAPLFAYIIRHGQWSGRFEKVYAGAIDALGALRVSDEMSLGALQTAAGAGEWWNPFRTKRLRTAAVRALRAIGTPEAVDVLETLASSGGYAAKGAARAALATVAGRQRPQPAAADAPPSEGAGAAETAAAPPSQGEARE
ncbi:MAG: HEAT repeat domain-containing protein [Vicinamibacterales bacterium]